MPNYFLFIDESGDHGLTTVDPDFPIFLLCGIIFPEEQYRITQQKFNTVKSKFWGEKQVIFHSRDIRKCNKEFQILLDNTVKQEFYQALNEVMTQENYRIIAAGIRKDRYIHKYGKLSNDVYEMSLSFIIERAVFLLDDIPGEKVLTIIIEKRGGKEDKNLASHFHKLKARGTGFVSADRIKALKMNIIFKDKKDNVNGLQLSDLIAYPVATYLINPARANPAYDLIKKNFYRKYGKTYGLKVFP